MSPHFGQGTERLEAALAKFSTGQSMETIKQSTEPHGLLARLTQGLAYPGGRESVA
jgi:hypothetical protein